MFEEIATMDFPFEGIPTVPPRKDMDHMAFFCGGCRWAAAAACCHCCSPAAAAPLLPLLLPLLLRLIAAW